MLDYGIQLLFKVRLPLLLGKTVICDRYVYDTLVDFVADFRLSGDKIAQLFSIPPLDLFAKPDLVFVLDLAESVASRRKGDATRGFLEYLTARRNLYLEIAKRFHASVLDASDFQKVQQLITNTIESAGVRRHD
jgi:dTMP kinase